MIIAAAALAVVLHLAVAFHALKTGRHYRWVLRILGLPFVGCIAYYIVELRPARAHRAAQKTACRLLSALSAGELRKAPAAADGVHATPLRIVFADKTAMAYTVDTAYEQPLGGSHSAACYLAEALTAAGHSVVLLNHVAAPVVSRGVVCLGWEHTPEQALRDFDPDAVVMLLTARHGEDLSRIFEARAKRVLWTGHAHDQPAVLPLKSAVERARYDAIAFMSEWQMRGFVREFAVDPQRTWVVGNALSPGFRGLYAPGASIGASKKRPPVLAYTSTPFRGLNLLLALFPEVRRRVPGTRLKVFSGMQVYQVPQAQDTAEYGELYRACRETDGVEYIGPVPQPQLAREMREVTALAYPNTFPETYCTAVLEAMAAGCRIVSSDLGALPQTTAGYARLVPMADREAYQRAFVEALVETLLESLRGEDDDLLARQVEYVNRVCTWEARAREWSAWLAALPPRTGPDATVAR